MTSQSGPIDRRHRSLRVRTYAQARAVLPYVASILRSLREHRLDALRHHLSANDWPTGLAGRSGIPCLLRKWPPVRPVERMRSTREPWLSWNHSASTASTPSPAGPSSPSTRPGGSRSNVYDLFDPQPLRFWAEHELCRGQGRGAD